MPHREYFKSGTTGQNIACSCKSPLRTERRLGTVHLRKVLLHPLVLLVALDELQPQLLAVRSGQDDKVDWHLVAPVNKSKLVPEAALGVPQ